MDTDRLNNLILFKVVHNLLGKLFHSFTPKSRPLFLIFISIELLHGGCCNIFAFVFGPVLEEDFLVDGGEGFFHDFSHGLLYQAGDEDAGWGFLHVGDDVM